MIIKEYCCADILSLILYLQHSMMHPPKLKMWKLEIWLQMPLLYSHASDKYGSLGMKVTISFLM